MFNNQKYFARYAWIYLIYNFYVILGGAYVRASGSGAGCGAHWPLCNGKIVPNFSIIHTIVEFTHRVSSGLVTIGGIILLIWAFACTSKGSPIRKAAISSFAFIIVEALLGAALVLFSLVESNSSNFRALMMALHLITTFMLLASISLTAAWSSSFPIMNINKKKRKLVTIITLSIGLLIIGTSGAITALGDTLFHPKYVGEGLIEDIQYKSHILKSIRIYHPILAIVISIYFILLCIKLTKNNSSKIQNNLLKIIVSLVIFQIILGFINIFLLAPIWTQLIHLFIADMLWVSSVLFFNSVLSD
jgi:cytochrome c oxidase assembly protein subunit 15